ncbi:MAG TPA: Nramp family divalent metal transporter, partial [Candidatus Acidoferrales bacterium]
FLGAGLGFFGFDLAAGRFRFFPEGADWFLIGAFAAYSGAGGVINLMLSNWARDKGFGMGQVTGYIPAAVGGKKVKLAHTGSVFAVTPDNMGRWRQWWRIISLDQWGVFFIGALLGMALPAILYTSFLPAGTDIRGLAIAAELAEAMLTRGGMAVGFVVALMGVWVLLKTQLDILDGMVRAITDILWTGSARVRAWRGGDVRWVYYSLLGLAVVWGVMALRLTQPIVLLQLGANTAGLVLVISGLHILYVNTRLLPPELRPPMWRRIALVGMVVFYGFFVWLWMMGGLAPNPQRGFLFTLLRSIGFVDL